MKQKLGEKKTEKPLAKMDEWNIRTKKHRNKLESWKMKHQPPKIGASENGICRYTPKIEWGRRRRWWWWWSLNWNWGVPYFQTNPETEQVAGSSGKIIFQFPVTVGISWGFHVTFQGWNSLQIHSNAEKATGNHHRRETSPWNQIVRRWRKWLGLRNHQDLPESTRNGGLTTRNGDSTNQKSGWVWYWLREISILKGWNITKIGGDSAVNLPQWTFCV
jgi:hypothetical protein